MGRHAMIPPQAADGREPSERFADLARRLLAVPKADIDRQEKRDAAHPKKPKHN